MVKNCYGELIACLNASKEFRAQPILAECIALRCIVKFCKELRLFEVQLEGED